MKNEIAIALLAVLISASCSLSVGKDGSKSVTIDAIEAAKFGSEIITHINKRYSSKKQIAPAVVPAK